MANFGRLKKQVSQTVGEKKVDSACKQGLNLAYKILDTKISFQ